ncbi:MAG: hypothetical protein AB9882_11800 [Ignavibacteriaceae bacterium]
MIEVKKTLEGFQKDHQDMANVLKSNVAALKGKLNKDEKTRLMDFDGLMKTISEDIKNINEEVLNVFKKTKEMLVKFDKEHQGMAAVLNANAAALKGKLDKDEKTRLMDFDSLMKNINEDIKNINDEVSNIFKNTNEMMEKFEKEHLDMSAELRTELRKNLSERVEYTQALINGFQKRLAEINKDNQKMAQKLRNDLAKGESTRLNEYKGILNGINVAIKGIGNEVKNIQKATAGMLGDYAKDRKGASAAWEKMSDTLGQLRNPVVATSVKEKKSESLENNKEIPVAEKKIEVKKEIPGVKAEPSKVIPESKIELTLVEKIENYINNHPTGVKITDMETPLGENRMRIGFFAKKLLDEEKVRKQGDVYYPRIKRDKKFKK